MKNIYQSLLLLIAGSTQKQLARQIKYLKVENQILRSKLPQRITIHVHERRRLAKFARGLGGALLRNRIVPLTKIRRSQRLGGLLKSFRRVAA